MGWDLSQGKGGNAITQNKNFWCKSCVGILGETEGGKAVLGVWDDGWGAVTGALGMYRVAIA